MGNSMMLEIYTVFFLSSNSSEFVIAIPRHLKFQQLPSIMASKSYRRDIQNDGPKSNHVDVIYPAYQLTWYIYTPPPKKKKRKKRYLKWWFGKCTSFQTWPIWVMLNFRGTYMIGNSLHLKLLTSHFFSWSWYRTNKVCHLQVSWMCMIVYLKFWCCNSATQ